MLLNVITWYVTVTTLSNPINLTMTKDQASTAVEIGAALFWDITDSSSKTWLVNRGLKGVSQNVGKKPPLHAA
jgi:hypothetical protein